MQLYVRRRFFYPPSAKDSYFGLVVQHVRAETQVGGSGLPGQHRHEHTLWHWEAGSGETEPGSRHLKAHVQYETALCQVLCRAHK